MRIQQASLAMDILLKMEIFGYGMLKLMTGTTLVTLKVQQAQQVRKV
jgi:hypothetical protein